MFLLVFSFHLGTNTLMILYWNERKLISSWRMNFLCIKNGVTNLTRDAFLMVCKKCSKNILKSKKITPRLNSFSTRLDASSWFRDATLWARVANFVKKPPLIVNVTNLELNGFDASLEVQQIPKSHNALINVFKFIRHV